MVCVQSEAADSHLYGGSLWFADASILTGKLAGGAAKNGGVDVEQGPWSLMRAGVQDFAVARRRMHLGISLSPRAMARMMSPRVAAIILAP
jgi:hypothetical protein